MDSLFNCICVLLSFSRVNCEDVVTEDFVTEDAEGFLMEYLGISITDAILYSVLLAGGYWFYQRNNTSDTSPAAVIHIKLVTIVCKLAIMCYVCILYMTIKSQL